MITSSLGGFPKLSLWRYSLFLGDCRKMEYRIGPDFGSCSRRGNQRL